MRVRYSYTYNQHTLAANAVAFLLLVSIFFPSCRRSAEEQPVMPPATNPLAREYIGYGVVTASFTHLLNESGSAGISQGYLRRGTVVRIIERKQVLNRGSSESWILVEANYQLADQRTEAAILRGWLSEQSLAVFDSERQANTASSSMSQ